MARLVNHDTEGKGKYFMQDDRCARCGEIPPGPWEEVVRDGLARLAAMDFAARLWRKDFTLWTNDADAGRGIVNALGWLDVADKMTGNVAELSAFVREVRLAGFRHVVHMGMGGSSLAPLAFAEMFGTGEEGLPLTVLDTTDPATVLRVEQSVPLEKTLFIEASKSGSTVESRSFGEYFYHRLEESERNAAGSRFAVITDPGSSLAKLASERNYRRAFLNYADIGGRYSALSYFGLLPAALLGMDVGRLLSSALDMKKACGAEVPLERNPGVFLGAVMGEMARLGRNKLTLLVPPALVTLGMWLEQLVAESTGKAGVGILPVVEEPGPDVSVYGDDRLFVCLSIENEPSEALERTVEALRISRQPVVVLSLRDRYDAGQEFFRWEIATATAGAILGINPFDQPNVQEAKDCTNGLLRRFAESRGLDEGAPRFTEGPLAVYGESGGASSGQTEADSMGNVMRQFFGQVRPGDYVALLAYLTEDAATEGALQSLRTILRDGLGLAVTMGYGPRYLHSTGQLHKGGPNTGLFLLLTADDGADLAVPDKPYSFGLLRRAQALGDLEALKSHGCRALRVHLGRDAAAGLAVLRTAVEKGLKS